MSRNPLHSRLISIVEPAVQGAGFELVDLRFVLEQVGWVLRVQIDHPLGANAQPVDLAACEAMSRELSAVLDVEDPIPQAYSLEVSSPGDDRVLRTRAHFERFVGARVKVELTAPREGRRRYTGTLLSIEETGIALEVDQIKVNVPFGEIGKARLAP